MTLGTTHGIALSSSAHDPRAPKVPPFTQLGIDKALMNAFSLRSPRSISAETPGKLAASVRTAINDAAFRATLKHSLSFTLSFTVAKAVGQDRLTVEGN
jgi:tripartite-type tricarboxylate transporter receptor subunit TctC